MVVIEFGYGNSYVMSAKDALALAEIIQRAEKYEKKYRKDEATGTNGYTFHVWPNNDEILMRVISEESYRLARLAGKPEGN